MSVLIDKSTRLLVQGLTGREGTFHAKQAAAYGTTVVGGVTPGKGGTTHEGWPIFDTVEDAVKNTGANTSVIFVPPRGGADAVMEAADAGLALVVCITEGIPTLDAMRALTFLKQRPKTRLIGPNCPGVISPGKAKAGIIPGHICKEGRIGIVSKSGTLTYEAIHQLTRLGMGQSTCIGIGGDPLIGTSHIDALKLFAADPETDAVSQQPFQDRVLPEDRRQFIEGALIPIAPGAEQRAHVFPRRRFHRIPHAPQPPSTPKSRQIIAVLAAPLNKGSANDSSIPPLTPIYTERRNPAPGTTKQICRDLGAPMKFLAYSLLSIAAGNFA